MSYIYRHSHTREHLYRDIRNYMYIDIRINMGYHRKYWIFVEAFFSPDLLFQEKLSPITHQNNIFGLPS